MWNCLSSVPPRVVAEPTDTPSTSGLFYVGVPRDPRTQCSLFKQLHRSCQRRKGVSNTLAWRLLATAVVSEQTPSDSSRNKPHDKKSAISDLENENLTSPLTRKMRIEGEKLEYVVVHEKKQGGPEQVSRSSAATRIGRLRRHAYSN